MYREGHIGLNALLYSPIAVALTGAGHVGLAVLGVAVALATATLPDVDRILPLVSHRGSTHTVWFAAAVGAATGYLATFAPLPYEPTVLFAFGLATGFGGVLGHFLGDVFTTLGIAPFSPLRRTEYRWGLFDPANRVVNAAVLLAGAVALALSFGAQTAVL